MNATRPFRPELLCAVLLALASTVPAGAQESTCPSEADPVGHLGLSVSCDCTVSMARWPERPWSFRSGIHVVSVEAGGPAAGKLQPGDTVVAVDGHAVATAEGARRMADLKPGERVTLTFRRNGREARVEVRPDPICPQDPRALGAYAVPVRAPEASSVPPPDVTQTPAGTPGPVPNMPDLLPPGRLGLALACRRCGWERGAGDAFPRWHSTEPPVVYSVAPRGPAEEAGIRAGDALLEVSGLAVTTRIAGEALGAAAPGQRLPLTLRRGGETYRTTLHVGSRESGAERADRYSGSFGGVRVDVQSEEPATVRVSEDGSTMIIQVAGTEVRLSTGPGGASRPRDR